MSKENLPDDLMDVLMSSKKRTSAVESTSDKRIKDVQKTDIKRTMKKYQIYFSEDEWEALSQHFAEQGLKTSAGVRRVLKEYMRREGI